MLRDSRDRQRRGRNSLQTDKTEGLPSNELVNFVTTLEKIVNKNSERQSSEVYAWRDVSFFMICCKRIKDFWENSRFSQNGNDFV